MSTDLKDQFWEAAEHLRGNNDYPYEMMPLLFALVKSTKGNANEAHKLIQEGRLEWNEESKRSKKSDENCVRKHSPRSDSKSPESPIHGNDGKEKPLDLRLGANLHLNQLNFGNLPHDFIESSGDRIPYKPYLENNCNSKIHTESSQQKKCEKYMFNRDKTNEIYLKSKSIEKLRTANLGEETKYHAKTYQKIIYNRTQPVFSSNMNEIIAKQSELTFYNDNFLKNEFARTDLKVEEPNRYKTFCIS